MGATELNESLLALVHQVNQAADFREALQLLAAESSRLLTCDGAAVSWLDGEYLEVLAVHGDVAPLHGLTLPVGQMGAARAALDSGRAMTIADTSLDTRWQPVPGEERVRSWLAVPLVAGEWALGLVEWTFIEPNGFGDEALALAGEIAAHLAPVVYRLQLLDDLRARLREQVKPGVQAGTQAVDLAAELQPVVREALDFAAARHAFVFLLLPGNNRLRCVAASGERRDQILKVTLRGDGTLGGWRVPLRSAPTTLAGSGASDREVMAGLGIEQTLILPLRVGGEQIGMLGVAERQRGGSFGRDAIRLMTHLASQASVLVERHQQAPAAARYDYETVFRASPLGIGVLSVAGDIQFCNPALAGLLSRSDRSLADRNLADFLAQGDAQRVMLALEEVAITGLRRQVDARVRSAQGEQRHVRLSLSLASLAGAGGGSLVAMMEDVTPLKILEQERVEHLRQLREKHSQLQDLDQLKSRFVSNVSHELRTPLAVIKLYATLARKGRPEKQSHYLQTIEQETHRLETMVENILDLTRMDRHALRVNPELIAAEEIISQILQVYDETAQKRAIELRNQVREPLPPLWADKNHLIQMLTNLVDNALKYTPRGGQVWVAARETEANRQRWLEIAVGDTGVGIPEEEQQQVFERFYRGTNNTPGSTGTGLGLAIVRELMVQHGGRVTLKSQAGDGSIFALHFPLFDEEDLATEPDED